jgi:hypothetical protein
MAAQPPLSSDPQADLTLWLDDFAPSDQSRGRAYYAEGRVRALSIARDGDRITVSTAVRGTRAYACHLSHEPNDGWAGDCSCPIGYDCKHLYASGLALQLRLAESLPPSAPASAGKRRHSAEPPIDHEAHLITQFTTVTGRPPDEKQRKFLSHLAAFHRRLFLGPYIDDPALHQLIPSRYRYNFITYHENPLANRWSQPPATPLELWSHLALAFTEKDIPLPPFMARLTDLAAARRAVAAHRLERELALWRNRFNALEADAAETPAADAPPTALSALRLRLAEPKPIWEISLTGSAHPDYRSISAATFRDLLYADDQTALALEPASASLATILQSQLKKTGRTALKLTNVTDLAFLARLLVHPLVRDCFVGPGGTPLIRESRRLGWTFVDHPTDPALCIARLAFPDGTLAPTPLLHLTARPALYLHLAGSTLYSGLPPLTQPDPDGRIIVPRAALILPEAGRYAARTGLTLPGETASRFRREGLRARLKASLAPRRPTPDSHEVLRVEFAALAPDGTPRAILDNNTWRTTGLDIQPPADAAFVLHDFASLQPAVAQFRSFRIERDGWHPEGPRDFADVNSDFAEKFPAWLAGFPAETVIELAPELAAFTQAPTRAQFTLDVVPGDEAGIDWFDVRVTLRAEDTALTPAELALLHRARGRFIRLPGGSWRRLALDDSAAAQEKLARLGLDPAATAFGEAREPLRFHALQLADESLRESLPEKLWAAVRDRAASLRASPPPPLPAGLQADLRPYQHEGFHFLAFLTENRFGGVLADDMGLGKTLQTLAWLLWLASRHAGKKPFRVLIVCPKSVVSNWQLETARFAPALTTTVFTSALVTPATSLSSAPQLSTVSSQLLILNYTQLRLHAEALTAEPWDAVILDEGQNIKNPASTTAQTARALRAAHRLVLTGTPVENRLLDLWSLFAFAQPGLLGGQASFGRLYNDKTDPTARTRLAQRVKHFLLRRTKNQVARDLPPRIEQDLEVDLTGPQRTLYDAELKRTRALLLGVKNNRDFDTQRFNILQSLLRLRQICCDSRLVGVEPAKTPIRKASRRLASAPATPESKLSASGCPPPLSAKLEALLDTLEPLAAEGHKVLIFSQFVTMLEFIRDELNARTIPHLMLTGQTENRQALVDKFQSDPAIPVFLLSLKAAGSGLNLTAASYVVLFDPWWNPAVEAQAIDRTHRIGQKNQVIAYRLIARDTVEEKIRALQKDKAALANAVVQEESLASVLDLDSLREILG